MEAWDPSAPPIVPGERLGVIGETGHANGPHLHFTVFDQEAGSAMNPLAFLPALTDHQPPVIRHVSVAAGEQRLPLENGVTLKPGRVEILVEAYDLREDVSFSWPLAPAAVSVSVDGMEISRISFDSLQVVDGKAVLDGGPLTRVRSTTPQDFSDAEPWSFGRANRGCAFRRGISPATRP